MIKYAAIGDSLTAGVGDEFGGGFVPRYASLAQQKFLQPVAIENMGVSGATTGDILSIVRSNSQARSILQEADMITITAGGNDLVDAAKDFLFTQNQDVFMKALIRCKKNYDGIVAGIRSLKSGQRSYLIRTVDLYNPFPSIPDANQWVQRFNRHIESFEDGNVKVAKIFRLFQGRETELLSFDRFHPNGRGYELIAEQLHKQGYSPLS
jgi:lysophospholipase L1-like esterase